jgi:hypothetical protein
MTDEKYIPPKRTAEQQEEAERAFFNKMVRKHVPLNAPPAEESEGPSWIVVLGLFVGIMAVGAVSWYMAKSVDPRAGVSPLHGTVSPEAMAKLESYRAAAALGR